MTEGDTPPDTPPREAGAAEDVPEELEEVPDITCTIEIPTMGGVLHQEDKWTPWTGGKPKPGWDKLVDPKPKSINPTQYRPTSIGAATKSQYYRTAGQLVKFTRKSDLLTFQKKLMNHLEEYGLDTITYIPSPVDATEMISVIDNHARFTAKEAKAAENLQWTKYDEYDHGNIRDAKKYLLNSLDESLEQQMYENCLPEDSFISDWMNLMLLVGTISIDRFDKIKDRLKARKLQQYPGEDVTRLCTDYMADFKELDGANMYDNNLTLTMVNSIICGGNEEFRSELRVIKKNLNDTLLKVRHQSYDEAKKTMAEAELDVRSVLTAAKEYYREQLDNGAWPAAQHRRDNRGIGRTFGQVNQAKATPKGNGANVNALQQNKGSPVKNQADAKCGFCGKKGHLEKDCFKKHGRPPFNSPSRKPKQGKPGRSPPDRSKQTKFPAPKPGESEVRHTTEGKTYYWCNKCRAWTISHGTDGHKTKEELQAERVRAQVNEALMNFDLQPCAFKAIMPEYPQVNQHTPGYFDMALQVSKPHVSELLRTATKCDKPTADRLIQDILEHLVSPEVTQRVSMAAEMNHGQLSLHRMVLFDSGANVCITNDKTDFVGHVDDYTEHPPVSGIGRALHAKAYGRVAWTFKSDQDSPRTLLLPCYYIPTASGCIASTGRILEEYPNEVIEITPSGLKLTGTASDPSITVQTTSGADLPMKPLMPLTDLLHDSKFPTAPPEPPALSLSLAAMSVISPVPYSQVTRARAEPKPTKKLPGLPSLTAEANVNLTEPQKELLRWHYKLGHVSMKRIQWLFRAGALATTEKSKRVQANAMVLITGPLCTACQYAKQRRKTKPGTTTVAIPDQQLALRRDRLFPGQLVSIDHFECTPRGRLINTFGKESLDDRFRGGCVFVDHASSYVYVVLQTNTSAHTTLLATQEFEAHCRTFGVIVQSYLTDSGKEFVNMAFHKHLTDLAQTAVHSASGAKHGNGIAERSIGTVSSIARAMLHHSALHWPDVADIALWPLAVVHAAYILNRVPRMDSGRSAWELLTQKTWPRSRFHDFHVFGSPCYVLNSTIADGKKIPKWQPRSQRSMYLGVGTSGSHSVPLVLNLDTGKITTQYHVVFDDWFQTVQSDVHSQIDFDHDDWYRTFGLTDSQYIPDEDAVDESSPDTTRLERELLTEREQVVRIQDARIPTEPIPYDLAQPAPPRLDPVPAPPVPLSSTPASAPMVLEAPVTLGPPAPPPQRETATPMQESPGHTPASPPAPKIPAMKPIPVPTKPAPVKPSPFKPILSKNSPPPKPKPKPDFEPIIKTRSQSGPRRSKRLQANHAELQPDIMSPADARPDLMQPLIAFWARMFDTQFKNVSHVKMSESPPVAHTTDNVEWSQTATSSSIPTKAKPNVYNYEEAMRHPRRPEFLAAMDAEIRQLEAHGTWEEDLKTNATSRIIPTLWVITDKTNPDGHRVKTKARLTVRGDLQENKGETYSPVAAWTTVRAFLLLSAVAGWHTGTMDFSNAFVQSELPKDTPVWIHVPRGYTSEKGPQWCLKLNKSLYGLAASPRLWVNYISDHFKELGLKQSQFDPCLWYGKDIMLVQYVDDMGIAGPTKQHVDQFVQRLRDRGLTLTQEQSFSEFLGIKFTNHEDGSIEMTQSGLIQKTLEAAGMSDCNPNSIPATQNALGANKDGPPFKEKWNPRAIVGMLLYLSTNTRPDIAYAVSQVARFTADPRQVHATAIKTILRYLKKTKDKGTIVRPAKHFHLDLYVDADFAGLYKQEDDRDPNSVRSRTGYVILLSGWPIIWKSFLQSHLSQSTLEAEYSALSSALKVFLPLKWLMIEMISAIYHEPLQSATIQANVFEDNQGAYYLAKNQRITNRTKYFLTKWHWFWDKYNEGQFNIHKCPTDAQLGDFLTKGLARDKFEANRQAVIGW